MAEIVNAQAADTNLIALVFGQPWVYIVVSLVIVLLIVMKLQGRKQRPEQRPFYGIEVREGMTNKELKRRLNSFGTKADLNLYKGFLKAGKILKIENIIRKTSSIKKPYKKKGDKTDKIEIEREEISNVIESYLFSYRKFGIVAYLKSLLGNYDFMVVSPEAAEIDYRKKVIHINPNAFFSNESGVWVIGKKGQIDLIDTINLQQDLTNTKGHLSDFPRRIANLDPGHAKDTGMVSHVFAEKEKEKRARVQRWGEG